MSKLIYIADDEENIRVLIKTFLENEGYEVKSFQNGTEIRKAFEERIPDLVILDVMMPGIDGLRLCTEFRKKSGVPIIIVSAKDAPLDKVTGLTLGCDDYLAKPFLPLELTARVKALFRRAEIKEAPDEETVYTCANMRVEQRSRKIYISDSLFLVTPTEFEFILYIIRRSGMAVSKKELLKAVWDYDDAGGSRVIDDLVKRLRKKLKECGCEAILETVWGYGYRLSDKDAYNEQS